MIFASEVTGVRHASSIVGALSSVSVHRSLGCRTGNYVRTSRTILLQVRASITTAASHHFRGPACTVAMSVYHRCLYCPDYIGCNSRSGQVTMVGNFLPSGNGILDGLYPSSVRLKAMHEAHGQGYGPFITNALYIEMIIAILRATMSG